jgi:hypothetical protein
VGRTVLLSGEGEEGRTFWLTKARLESDGGPLAT